MLSFKQGMYGYVVVGIVGGVFYVKVLEGQYYFFGCFYGDQLFIVCVVGVVVGEIF